MQVLLDACQSVPHLKIDAWLDHKHLDFFLTCLAFFHLQGVFFTTSKDVADLDVDFLVASSVSTQNFEA